jgi:transposase-like protein
MHQHSADAMAARILLKLPSAERQKQLKALEARARQSIGLECPKCGSDDVEDNGKGGWDRTFRCCSCNHQWDGEEP